MSHCECNTTYVTVVKKTRRLGRPCPSVCIYPPTVQPVASICCGSGTAVEPQGPTRVSAGISPSCVMIRPIYKETSLHQGGPAPCLPVTVLVKREQASGLMLAGPSTSSFYSFVSVLQMVSPCKLSCSRHFPAGWRQLQGARGERFDGQQTRVLTLEGAGLSQCLHYKCTFRLQY